MRQPPEHLAVEVPPGLALVDVDDDARALHWLDLRDRYRSPEANPGSLTLADLRDEHEHFAGELLRVVGDAAELAASLFTVVDSAGAGGTYLTIFAAVPVPSLDALLTLANERAAVAGGSFVHVGCQRGAPIHEALLSRHAFHAHETWRRFELDLVAGPPPAFASPDQLAAAGVHLVTLAERPELLEALLHVRRAGLHDTPGDFPRPDETPGTWLDEIDRSVVLERSLVFGLVDDAGTVVAMLQLERIAQHSDIGRVEFLAVDRAHRGRGLARLVKRAVSTRAREQGLVVLVTENHATNAPMCALNESLGWRELRPRIALRAPVSVAGLMR